MNIAELVFAQKYGIFFVWKMDNEKVLITFLRNRTNISPEIQIENALHDGRECSWTLIGVGHWQLCPIEGKDLGSNTLNGVSLTMHTVTAAPLRLKKLSEREMRSTTAGLREMREKWVPHVCARLRKILWEEDGE